MSRDGQDRHERATKVEYDEKTGVEKVTDKFGRVTITKFGAPAAPVAAKAKEPKKEAPIAPSK